MEKKVEARKSRAREDRARCDRRATRTDDSGEAVRIMCASRAITHRSITHQHLHTDLSQTCPSFETCQNARRLP